jgi:hypothetical protein
MKYGLAAACERERLGLDDEFAHRTSASLQSVSTIASVWDWLVASSNSGFGESAASSWAASSVRLPSAVGDGTELLDCNSFAARRDERERISGAEFRRNPNGR